MAITVGGGPRVVVSTAAFHARVRGSVPGLGGLKETKMFLPHPRLKVSIVGSLRDREVACSASDRQGSNFESCVWRTVSSQSSHHPQEVLLAQFSLYVHKGGLKPDSFHLAITVAWKLSHLSRGIHTILILYEWAVRTHILNHQCQSSDSTGRQLQPLHPGWNLNTGLLMNPCSLLTSHSKIKMLLPNVKCFKNIQTLSAE